MVVIARTTVAIWLVEALFVSMGAFSAESRMKIDNEQAVKIAEKYVVEHGFTRFDSKADRVIRELMPAIAQPAVMVKSLPPKAPKTSLELKGFAVAFRYAKTHGEPRLTVFMNEFGDVVKVQNPIVEHANTIQPMTKANRVIFCGADCMESYDQAAKLTGGSSEADKDFDFSEYLSLIQPMIKKNWHPPYDGDLCTILKFTINRDGSLGPIKTIRSSCVGSEEAARRAIEVSAPFPALPAFCDDDKLDIKFAFDYNVSKKSLTK